MSASHAFPTATYATRASRLACLACEGFCSAWSSAKQSDQFLLLADVISTPSAHSPQAPSAHIPATHMHKQFHISYLHRYTPACLHTCLHMLIIVLIHIRMHTQLYENKHKLALHILSTYNYVHTPVSMPTCIHECLCSLIHAPISLTYMHHTCLEPQASGDQDSLFVFCMTLPVSSCHLWRLVNNGLSELEGSRGQVCFISSFISELSKVPAPYGSLRNSQR